MNPFRANNTTSRMRRPGVWVALAAASTLLLSACDGDGDLMDQARSGLDAAQSEIAQYEAERGFEDGSSGGSGGTAEPEAQPEGEGEVAPAENPVGTFDGPSGQALVDQSVKALDTLESLEVKGRAPKTGYSRDEFGPNWSDDVTVAFGGNGCDTRNDILARDLKQITYRDDDPGCTVATGVLDDPYTATTIDFTRGRDSSMDVHIDHIVALSDAWQKGAQQLSEDQRRNFANDPRNLLAVDGAANRSKSDSDASGWLPPNNSYRCTFVAKQIQVKDLYDLWVTPAEHEAMVRVLEPCAGR